MRIARVFSRTGAHRDLIIGGAFALGVSALGWLAIAAALTPDAADTSIRDFGTLLAVLFGIVAAVWWNQSAKLANKLVDQDAPARQSQKDANTLNGAAATFTALALFSSVFASSPWRSTASWLCALGVLLLLAMSGSDIRQAVPISLKQRLELREILGLLSLAVVTAAFIWHLMT
jgi:hypothetical protein